MATATAAREVLHVYHVPKFRSTRVVWLLAELSQHYRLPFDVWVHEFTDVASFRNEKPNWLLALNPNGKIPVVQLGSRAALIEGGAIMLSILDAVDVESKLTPDRDLLYQLAFYCCGTVDNVTATSSPIQRAEMMHRDGVEVRLEPTVDPIRKTAWSNVIAPYLEDVLGRTEGDYFCGEAFSAVDVVVGMDLFAFDERMIARGDGRSWIDAVRTPHLRVLADILACRPARQFAFETSILKNNLNNLQEFGIARWLPAS